MVELQHHRIGFPAIHTRMLFEICQHELYVSLSVFVVSGSKLTFVLFVVVPRPLILAGLAVGVFSKRNRIAGDSTLCTFHVYKYDFKPALMFRSRSNRFEPMFPVLKTGALTAGRWTLRAKCLTLLCASVKLQNCSSHSPWEEVQDRSRNETHPLRRNVP